MSISAYISRLPPPPKEQQILVGAAELSKMLPLGAILSRSSASGQQRLGAPAQHPGGCRRTEQELLPN